MMRTALPWLLLALLACALPARADTTCVASAAPTLDFGFITSNASGNTDVPLTISVTCTTNALSVLATASVRMCLGLGTGSTGTTLQPTRSMTLNGAAPPGTGDTLNYQLYSNAARSVVWGTTPGATPAALQVDLTYPVPVTNGSGTVNSTIYARVPASQVLSAGTFSSSYSGAAVTLQYAYNERLALSAPMPSACTTITGVSGHKTASGQFPFVVSATVLPSCSTAVTTDMDFGSTTGALGSAIDRTSTITLNCINRTAYTIGLNNGQNAAGNVRRMRHATDSSNLIAYELYRDSGRTVRWGNTLNVDTAAGTGNGSAQLLTVYGRTLPLAAGTPMPRTGDYSDLVTVTITY